MLNFEGFDIDIKVSDRSVITAIASGNHTQITLKSTDFNGVFTVGKMVNKIKGQILKWKADATPQSAFLLDESGKIIYTNLPFNEQDFLIENYLISEEGIFYIENYNGQNKTPVTLTISCLNYGGYSFCTIESIRQRSLTALPVQCEP